jgi:hypothetical protein
VQGHSSFQPAGSIHLMSLYAAPARANSGDSIVLADTEQPLPRTYTTLRQPTLVTKRPSAKIKNSKQNRRL